MLPFFWEAKAKKHGFASFAALVGPFAYLLLTHVNPMFGLGCAPLPCRFSRKLLYVLGRCSSERQDRSQTNKFRKPLGWERTYCFGALIWVPK